MVKLFTSCYGKGNFKTFKKHFDIFNGFWIQYIWDDSLFYFSNTMGDSEFHADIFHFVQSNEFTLDIYERLVEF